MAISISGTREQSLTCLWQHAESYLNVGKRTYQVCAVNGRTAKIILKAHQPNWLLLALKILSFATVIFPLIALIIRTLYRSQYTFSIVNAFSPLLEKMITIRKEEQAKAVESLSDEDFRDLEVILSKVTPANETEEGEFQKLRLLMSYRKLLASIYADHPTWKTAADLWKEVSIVDKLWLLQLYQLYHSCDINLPQINALYNANLTKSLHLPSESTPELLQLRNEVEKVLDGINKLNLDLQTHNLKKCPDAICLLTNLKAFTLKNSNFTIAPDLTKNVNLKALILSFNKFTAPPDLTKNVKLERVFMDNNEFADAPDLTKNVNLITLHLTFNKFTTAPDLTQNVNLVTLCLSNNQLTIPPDLTHNIKLQMLTLYHNQLTTAPDLTKNVNLINLYLYHNQLTTAPDLTQNVKLNSCNLRSNQLTDAAKRELQKQLPNCKKLYF